MYLYLFLCLGITLFVMEEYVMLRVDHREHRLLPVILATSVLYDFYQLVELIFGETAMMAVLEDLFVIQMLYLLITYVKEFLPNHLPSVAEALGYFSLLFFDGYIIRCSAMGISYKRGYEAACTIYFIMAAYIILKAFFLTHVSREERQLHFLLFVSAATPIILMEYHLHNERLADMLIPGAMTVSSIIIYYLMLTDKLVDTGFFLSVNIYDTMDTPILLFDRHMEFLRGNIAANEQLPQLVKELEISRTKSTFRRDLIKSQYTGEAMENVYYGGRYYHPTYSAAYYNDHVKGYIVSLSDITFQYKMTEAAYQQREEAVERTARKSLFLAEISHDLRSPLHAILGLADILLRRHSVAFNDKAMVRDIKHSGEALLDMVNEVLDYSKLESDHFLLHSKRYSFRDLLEEIACQAIVNLSNKEVEFCLNITTDYPEYVMGDQAKVRQMLQNIVNNAVKFTNRGSIEITVDCQRIETETSDGSLAKQVRFNFCVEDTGIGIQKDQIDVIFEEYTTFASEHAKEGTGLGLYIVKKLSEQMGGNCFARSDGKTGAIVGVSFIQQMEESILFHEAEKMDTDILKRVRLSQKMDFAIPFIYPDAEVLVADDMDVNLTIFREAARPWQTKIDTVLNGQEAVIAAQNKKYDLIVLDQMMPVMTGSEAAKKLKEITDAPIILMSAADTKDQIDYVKDGFVDILTKPIEMENFARCLKEYLPENKRVMNESGSMPSNTSDQSILSYYRVLESFVHESNYIKEHLEEMFREDTTLFRTKVHGLKGILRQLHKYEVSEEAEIMEMAIKSGHEAYIMRHLQEFLDLLGGEIEEAKAELALAPKSILNASANSTQGQTTLDYSELKDSLHRSLLEYDLSKAENFLAYIKKIAPEEEHDFLVQISKKVEMLDYEEAAKMIEEL